MAEDPNYDSDTDTRQGYNSGIHRGYHSEMRAPRRYDDAESGWRDEDEVDVKTMPVSRNDSIQLHDMEGKPTSSQL